MKVLYDAFDEDLCYQKITNTGTIFKGNEKSFFLRLTDAYESCCATTVFGIRTFLSHEKSKIVFGNSRFNTIK